MSKSRVLLISNSRQGDNPYLGHAESSIKAFLGKQVQEALFIPWASVVVSYEEYTNKVMTRFGEFGIGMKSIHQFPDPVQAIECSQAIVVGGGNTFKLLYELQESRVSNVIRRKVENGTPYIGWSAGANIAGPTIMTTNDMPVVWPKSVEALNLVPFQINPHYTDAVPPGFSGETRKERITEFTLLHQKTYVVGMREGAIITIGEGAARLEGESTKIFLNGKPPMEYKPGDPLEFLLTGEDLWRDVLKSYPKPGKKVLS
ncbi:MAG: dipeptidase PepE [Nitrospira sp. BO4]|jgi:dipeptidase E|nr:dipeptidase PepE [Nitrospira sp. BO4]